MTQAGIVSEFTQVDRAPDTDWFVSFMDRANALPEYAEMRLRLITELSSGGDILDVGCGTGDDARELAAALPEARVVGVDSSAAMVAVAEQRNVEGGPEFRTGDVADLPFADASFDGARAKLTLMHCQDLDAALASLVRVLRPGARLTCFDYDFDTTTIDHPDQTLTRAITTALSNAHPGTWTARALRRHLLDLGLDNVTVLPLTVQMPWEFWSQTVHGRILASVAAGDLDANEAQVAEWWGWLEDAAAKGLFHTSITGFQVSGTTR